MVFESSLRVSLVMLAALLAGCGSRMRGHEEMIMVSVGPDASGNPVPQLPNKGYDIQNDGNPHDIHWQLDSKAQQAWQFLDYSNDVHFTYPSNGRNVFNPVPSASSSTELVMRDKLNDGHGDHKYLYQLVLHRIASNPDQTIVLLDTDPAITNHGR